MRIKLFGCSKFICHRERIQRLEGVCESKGGLIEERISGLSVAGYEAPAFWEECKMQNISFM